MPTIWGFSCDLVQEDSFIKKTDTFTQNTKDLCFSLRKCEELTGQHNIVHVKNSYCPFVKLALISVDDGDDDEIIQDTLQHFTLAAPICFMNVNDVVQWFANISSCRNLMFKFLLCFLSLSRLSVFTRTESWSVFSIGNRRVLRILIPSFSKPWLKVICCVCVLWKAEVQVQKTNVHIRHSETRHKLFFNLHYVTF